MICDGKGVPLQERQSVAFYWHGARMFVGRIEKIEEIVAPGKIRTLKISTVIELGIQNEAGPNPKVSQVLVTAAQEEEQKTPSSVSLQ